MVWEKVWKNLFIPLPVLHVARLILVFTESTFRGKRQSEEATQMSLLVRQSYVLGFRLMQGTLYSAVGHYNA